MLIIGKSAVDTVGLQAKKDCTKYLELQLFYEWNDGLTVENVYNVVTSVADIEIVGVHVPIFKNSLTNIEYLSTQMSRDNLYKSLALAGELSKFYGRIVKVIIHNALMYSMYDRNQTFWLHATELFATFLNKYPLLEFCIENVCPVKLIDGEVTFKNGVYTDNVLLCKRLNSEFGTTRFGTVLDTCHAITTCRTCDRLRVGAESVFPQLTLEDFFREYADTCKLIHLATVDDLGLVPGTHGRHFREDEREEMEEIIRLYKKYECTADITIEVPEQDYSLSNNFKANYKMLLGILEKI